MTISGFTFVKNGVLLGYPFLESIQSVLPVCDEVVVVVGKSEDDTRERIVALNEKKVKIIDTVWDPDLRTGGAVLAQQTNIAKANISGDWGFYIQADEVIHEKYLSVIQKAAELHLHNPKVQGLLFGFRHFYGSYKYYGLNRDWYRNEIRMIKNHPDIVSYKDAMGFRDINNQKLRVKKIPVEMYHYGWVKSPEDQNTKKKLVSLLWHDDESLANNKDYNAVFRYNRRERLEIFKDEHPKVMKERISLMDWKFPYDPTKVKMSLKEKLSMLFENVTGIQIAEYKNYREL